MESKETCLPPLEMEGECQIEITDNDGRLLLRAFGVPKTYRYPDGSYKHVAEFYDPADEFPAYIDD